MLAAHLNPDGCGIPPQTASSIGVEDEEGLASVKGAHEGRVLAGDGGRTVEHTADTPRPTPRAPITTAVAREVHESAAGGIAALRRLQRRRRLNRLWGRLLIAVVAAGRPLREAAGAAAVVAARHATDGGGRAYFLRGTAPAGAHHAHR